MCYVGKATKIFIFIVTVLVVLGLVLGFGLLRRSLQKNHKCSGDDCHSPPAVFPDPILSPPNQNPSSEPISAQPSAPTTNPIAPPPPPPSTNPTQPPPPPPNTNPIPPQPPSPLSTPAATTPSTPTAAAPPLSPPSSAALVTPGPLHA
ncbi:proline-rich receptor-like protein kinase PERK10 [Quillaja saponaria]|uniref:Proline-rich receptor-like protein kinase PERK10 n=1 Tax=Quillaja saponaria TaxID=32244 RepID=A0AAD7KZT2_QUISA|nr:proline-rich receptor-like protein kinase PERK10 [Quillaja saponaria]